MGEIAVWMLCYVDTGGVANAYSYTSKQLAERVAGTMNETMRKLRGLSTVKGEVRPVKFIPCGEG